MGVRLLLWGSVLLRLEVMQEWIWTQPLHIHRDGHTYRHTDTATDTATDTDICTHRLEQRQQPIGLRSEDETRLPVVQRSPFEATEHHLKIANIKSCTLKIAAKERTSTLKKKLTGSMSNTYFRPKYVGFTGETGSAGKAFGGNDQ